MRSILKTPKLAASCFRAAAVFWVAVIVGACEEPAPVKVGFVGGFEGRNADLAQVGRDGALLAMEEFNTEGGLDGRPVELIVRDDQNDPEVAAEVDRQLIDEGVVAILGHMTSQMSVAGVPVANENEVVLLSPTASTNDLTGIDDYFLRVYAPNAGDAEALALLAREHLDVKTVSAIYDVDNRAHTETWLRAFSEAFEANGGHISIAQEFGSSQEVSLLAAAENLLIVNPDAIFVLAGSLDTALVCQHLRNHGFYGPVLTSQWSVTPEILKHAGATANGIYFIDTFSRDSPAPAYSSFRKRFEQRFSYEPGFAATFAYEAATVLLEGVKRTQDRKKIKDVILDIGEFSGLQSRIKFDRFGDVNRPRYFKTIRDGRFVDAG